VSIVGVDRSGLGGIACWSAVEPEGNGGLTETDPFKTGGFGLLMATSTLLLPLCFSGSPVDSGRGGLALPTFRSLACAWARACGAVSLPVACSSLLKAVMMAGALP